MAQFGHISRHLMLEHPARCREEPRLLAPVEVPVGAANGGDREVGGHGSSSCLEWVALELQRCPNVGEDNCFALQALFPSALPA
jgi:hypothetical protein